MFSLLAETEGQMEMGDRTEEKGQKRRLNVPKVMFIVSECIYGEDVTPL